MKKKVPSPPSPASPLPIIAAIVAGIGMALIVYSLWPSTPYEKGFKAAVETYTREAKELQEQREGFLGWEDGIKSLTPTPKAVKLYEHPGGQGITLDCNGQVDCQERGLAIAKTAVAWLATKTPCVSPTPTPKCLRHE